MLKELAVNTPTFFFQQVQQFFDCIFNAVRDPKVRLNLIEVTFVFLLYGILKYKYG